MVSGLQYFDGKVINLDRQAENINNFSFCIQGTGIRATKSKIERRVQSITNAQSESKTKLNVAEIEGMATAQIEKDIKRLNKFSFTKMQWLIVYLTNHV
jgi:hypothetical protein